MSHAVHPRLRPVVKWPGGKSALVDSLLNILPRTFNHYYEPFAGSAAVFLALLPPDATISDRNYELINFYEVLRTHPLRLFESISRLPNNSTTYYRLRGSTPASSFQQARRFLYLNRTCFGGLYRLNRSEAFNVPFGKNGRTVLPDRDRFMTVAKAFQGVSLRCDDFQTVLSNANRGDLVYFDPPYTVAHNNNGFLRYNATLFSWKDQERLKSTVDILTANGVSVVVTNADHPSLRNLYRGYNMKSLVRASTLSARPQLRRPTTELLVTNY